MSTKIDGDSIHIQTVLRKRTRTTITTASNVTYTAAQLIGGTILRDTNGANRTDTTPTAAQIVSEMQNKNSATEDGTSYSFYWVNNGANDLTLVAGTGVTLFGKLKLKNGKAMELGVVIDDDTASSEAVSIIGLSQVVTP